jgi:hypothetical protein
MTLAPRVFVIKLRATFQLAWCAYRMYQANTMITWALFKVSVRGVWSIK